MASNNSDNDEERCLVFYIAFSTDCDQENKAYENIWYACIHYSFSQAMNVWTRLLLLQILIVNVTFVLSEKWANAQNLLTLLIDDFSLQLSAFLMMTLLRRSAPI